ncbi:MAG: type II secretion system protein GspE, partial [Clostridiales Family XIII bacterium]|nr:type II secretion system protein GspE [Clostridiales Family XIII bacterium]
MADNRQVRIGDLLKEYGYLDDDQLQRALEYQKSNNVRLGQAVIQLGFVTEAEVIEALSHKLGIPVINLETARVDTNVVSLIPRSLAEKNIAIAVEEHDGHLHLAINDPLNFYGVEELQQVSGMPVELMISDRAGIENAIRHYYSEVEARAAVNKADTDYANLFPEINEINTVEVGDDSTPVVNLLNSLMLRGYNNGASDLHIEPFDSICKVRMRVDGALVDYAD